MRVPVAIAQQGQQDQRTRQNKNGKEVLVVAHLSDPQQRPAGYRDQAQQSHYHACHDSATTTARQEYGKSNLRLCHGNRQEQGKECASRDHGAPLHGQKPDPVGISQKDGQSMIAVARHSEGQ